MMSGLVRAHRIFNQNQAVTVLESRARRGLHADIGGDAAKDDVLDTAAAQLQIQFRAVERTPLPLGDADVVRRRWQTLRIVPPVFRQRTSGIGLIDRLLEGIGEVRCETHAHAHHKDTDFPAARYKTSGTGQHFFAGVRSLCKRDDASLQVDQDQCRRARVELVVGHVVTSIDL